MTVHTFLQQLLFSKKGFHLHLMSLNISSRFSRNSEVFASTLLPIFCFTKVKSETNTRLLWIELYSEASASEDRLVAFLVFLTFLLCLLLSLQYVLCLRYVSAGETPPDQPSQMQIIYFVGQHHKCVLERKPCEIKRETDRYESFNYLNISYTLEYFLYI